MPDQAQPAMPQIPQMQLMDINVAVQVIGEGLRRVQGDLEMHTTLQQAMQSVNIFVAEHQHPAQPPEPPKRQRKRSKPTTTDTATTTTEAPTE